MHCADCKISTRCFCQKASPISRDVLRTVWNKNKGIPCKGLLVSGTLFSIFLMNTQTALVNGVGSKLIPLQHKDLPYPVINYVKNWANCLSPMQPTQTNCATYLVPTRTNLSTTCQHTMKSPSQPL